MLPVRKAAGLCNISEMLGIKANSNKKEKILVNLTSLQMSGPPSCAAPGRPPLHVQHAVQTPSVEEVTSVSSFKLI